MSTEQLDEFHKHELLDRIHCINVMFEELIVNHPAARLIKLDIDEVDQLLGELYQTAGGVVMTEQPLKDE